MGESHVIGLLLGTEEDWPSAFEALFAALEPEITYAGNRHTFDVQRITTEPFRLRTVPRYSLVIDTLAHWYWVPREWLKKVALMDDVYLMNNPFTFQAMEKHAACCAMIRLGLNIPETWMIPHKNPPENERFPYTAAKYNLPFRLEDSAKEVGYPLYMKPFAGGGWVGVTRVADDEELNRSYDESGQRLMHLQAAVENFDSFTRSINVGAETLVTRYEPSKPYHDRYQVDHAFLSPELGEEVETISKVVSAFFRWDYNSCETIIKDGRVSPVDFANACPETSMISLHYYFPWAIKALVKWSMFCIVTGRKMPVDQNTADYFAIADSEELGYFGKLAAYRELADSHFQMDAYEEFCSEHLARVDEVMVDYIESDTFDRLLVETVKAAFPSSEHETFIAHYRGMLAAWAKDQRAAA